MDRRKFFKVVGTASGGVMSGACGKQAEEIIPLLVPEDEIVPGVEEWHASVCQECGAACGTVARVMASEREIEVDGERLRQRIAAVKKLEGNPEDPVSGGRLCARGHSALQALYNPDRLTQPLKRAGERGSGRFEPVPWDVALDEASSALGRVVSADPGRILFLAPPRAGSRAANIARFLKSVGAPSARSIGFADFAAEIEGSRRAFGWEGVPVYEIQDATMVLSIGADFLGGWLSPVMYSRRYGHMRQGRRELRGRLIHAESRFSLTAWNADRWLPVRPGGELALALGIGRALVVDDLMSDLDGIPASVVSAFADADPDRIAAVTGIPVDAMREVAADLAAASRPLVVAGASIVRPNSADAVAAAGALNLLLGTVGEVGGLMPSSGPGTDLESSRPVSGDWVERLAEAELVFLDGVDPAYVAPHCASTLAAAGTVISFSRFLDDSSVLADLILPDHDALERSVLAVPDTSPVPSVAAAAAFVAPLHESRPTETVLAALAGAVGKPYEEFSVESGLAQLHAVSEPAGSESDPQALVAESLHRGGWRGRRPARESVPTPHLGGFETDALPEGLLFQVYPSPQFGDGSGANRPWLQELPDPTSSAMWGIPAELDPATARELGVSNGDLVRIESAHGSLEAPAYVNPAAIPGVVSMALGPGHGHYGRYASGLGSNPMSVVGDLRDRATGASALGPVPVRIEKASGEGRLIQFSRQDRDVLPHRV